MPAGVLLAIDVKLMFGRKVTGKFIGTLLTQTAIAFLYFSGSAGIVHSSEQTIVGDESQSGIGFKLESGILSSIYDAICLKVTSNESGTRYWKAIVTVRPTTLTEFE